MTLSPFSVFLLSTVFLSSLLLSNATVVDQSTQQHLQNAAKRMRQAIRQDRLSSKSGTSRQTTVDTSDDIHGFTTKVNEGTGIFRPILPGTDVASANEFPPADRQTDTVTEPTPEPSSSADDPSDGNDSVCFPSDAQVQLSNGMVKSMDKIEIGDSVLVSNSKDEYSSVFMFTHRLKHIKYKFIQLNTLSNHSITLTPSHYIYIDNKQLVQAKSVEIGDSLVISNDSGSEGSEVISIQSIVKHGLYNPQTLHGDIIVNGVKVSTYTDTIQLNTAHALLAPLRAVYDTLGLSFTCMDNGAAFLTSLIPSKRA